MSIKPKFQRELPADSQQLYDWLEPIDPNQIEAWRHMGPIKRFEIAFQAYQFPLEAVRLTEQQNHPELSAEELNWRIVQRMQRREFASRQEHA